MKMGSPIPKEALNHKKTSALLDITIISPVNDDLVLESNLLASPDIQKNDIKLLCQRGFSSAAAAYNDALSSISSCYVLMCHQDVFFPEGWFHDLDIQLKYLSENDPNWGVAGVWGTDATGKNIGNIYTVGMERLLGRPFPIPQKVRTLDEVLLVIRKDSGLIFDTNLKSWHMYATDLSLLSELEGMNNYVLPCLAIHNSNGYRCLPEGFWESCLFIRKKWRNRLPIETPNVKVTKYAFEYFKHRFKLKFGLYEHRRPGLRISNPALIAEEIIGKNII